MPILKPFLKLSKLFSLFILALSLLLLGCQSANHIEQSQGFNVEKILNKVKLHKTTERQLREYLGTPAYEATCLKDNQKVIGFVILGDHFYSNLSKGAVLGYLTLGIKSKIFAHTLKFITAKVDDNGKIIDIKANGVTYNKHMRLSTWLEYKRTLTVNELKSEVNFSTDEVKKTFIENYNKMHKTKFQSLSSKQKEKVIVTKTVNDYQTEAYLYGQKIFGSFSEFITPLPQNYDGDKALSIFSLKN
ncbi:MAG: hypothetical protein SPF26_02585 [Succinivibrio sp.]|nr:hypothetical protein [Succinivibrio sp.]